MITLSQPQLNHNQKIKIMKSRNPIRSSETMTPLKQTNSKHEFKIKIFDIRNCEVTSIDRRKIYGLPSVYVSIYKGIIVGLTNVFRTNPVDGKYYLPSVPSNTNSKSIQFADECHRDSFFKLDCSHRAQNIRDKAFPPEAQHISELLAKKLQSRIFAGAVLGTKCPLQITFMELFQAIVTEAMSLNRQLKLQELGFNELDKNSIPLPQEEHLESMFWSSLIYRKKIWWVNLFSKEVIANEFGINYKGQYYMPIEDRDIFVLEKLVKAKHNPSVTIYVHPETPWLVYWVFENRMILIRPLEQRKHKALHLNQIELSNQTF